MIVDGEFTFSAHRDVVWVLLQDPEVLVKAMPGAKRLVTTGDGVYEGVIRIGVGPVTAAEWKLGVTLSNKVAPASYSMAVESKGPLGFTRGTATVELVDGGASTTMKYHADLHIGGKVAGIGQRLLDQVARLMTRQGLEALSREIAARIGLAGDLVAGGAAPHDAADYAAAEHGAVDTATASGDAATAASGGGTAPGDVDSGAGDGSPGLGDAAAGDAAGAGEDAAATMADAAAAGDAEPIGDADAAQEGAR